MSHWGHKVSCSYYLKNIIFTFFWMAHLTSEDECICSPSPDSNFPTSPSGLSVRHVNESISRRSVQATCDRPIGVNFINILPTRFSYESASRRFSLVTIWRKKHFRMKKARVKCWWNWMPVILISRNFCDIATRKWRKFLDKGWGGNNFEKDEITSKNLKTELLRKDDFFDPM